MPDRAGGATLPDQLRNFLTDMFNLHGVCNRQYLMQELVKIRARPTAKDGSPNFLSQVKYDIFTKVSQVLFLTTPLKKLSLLLYNHSLYRH